MPKEMGTIFSPLLSWQTDSKTAGTVMNWQMLEQNEANAVMTKPTMQGPPGQNRARHALLVTLLWRAQQSSLPHNEQGEYSE